MTPTPEAIEAEADDPVRRRFGRDHDKPCNDPNVLSCSRWACQSINRCARAVIAARPKD
jgi:hypothetical protein